MLGWAEGSYLALGLHADVLRDAGVQHVLDAVVREHGVDVDRVGVAADDVIRRLDDDGWVLPRLAVVPDAAVTSVAALVGGSGDEARREVGDADVAEGRDGEVRRLEDPLALRPARIDL